MTGSLIYFGDTALGGAAAYLAGILTHAGWRYDYVPSHVAADAALLATERRAFILSDYPAAMFDAAAQRLLLAQVERGAGLLMCGGWESFHGLGGDWNGTPIGEALPVEIANADDRVNCDRPVLVRRLMDHPVVAGLPWKERPPVIGGYNRVRAKSEASVLLEAQQFASRYEGEAFVFEPAERDPLLIVGACGGGRTAALTTDVAPHWVGPLVDWGPRRTSAQAPGAEAVEVGCDYARLLEQLVRWVGGQEDGESGKPG